MSNHPERTPQESATERGYSAGKHAAWRQVLLQALRELDICKDPADDAMLDPARVVEELEDTRAALRRLCNDLDVPFNEDLYLADIVEKVIAPHIEEAIDG